MIYLQPDESFLRYNPNEVEKEVNAFIRKINIINEHSKEELELAKARAIARRQKRESAMKKPKQV